MKTLQALLRWAGHQRMLFVVFLLSASGHVLALIIIRPEILPTETPARLTPFEVTLAPSSQLGTRLLSQAGLQQTDAALEIFDPGLIAASGARGFSARVSMGLTPRLYERPQRAQQPQLTETSQIQDTRVPLLSELSIAQTMAATMEKSTAPSFEETIDAFLEPPTQAFPVLEWRGGLEQRTLAVQFRLPQLASPPPSLPCVFRVAVDASGWVRVVILESSSKNDEADTKAADALRRCKFAPINVRPAPLAESSRAEPLPVELDWGKAVVAWPAPAPKPEEKTVEPEPTP